jgi:hypothetical protein
MLEVALVLPVVFELIMGTIDFGRYALIEGYMQRVAFENAQLLSVHSEDATDCNAQNAMAHSSNGFTLSEDPNSYLGDGDPIAGTGRQPTVPAAASDLGYSFVYPAGATAAGIANCSGGANSRKTQGGGSNFRIEVELNYALKPWTPGVRFFKSSLPIRADATAYAQY